jgi:hypothetical protein
MSHLDWNSLTESERYEIRAYVTRAFKYVIQNEGTHGAPQMNSMLHFLEELRYDKNGPVPDWARRLEEIATGLNDQQMLALKDQILPSIPLTTQGSLSLKRPSSIDILIEWKSKRNKPLPSTRLFRCIEMFARILPTRIRLQTFEPAYNDEKAAYLIDRRKYKTPFWRGWLKVWFVIHVGWMIPQCLLGMCGDKVKRLVLSFLPDYFRKILGG